MRIVRSGQNKRRRAPEHLILAGFLLFFSMMSLPLNAASVEDFVAACLASTNFEESICECMADKGQQRLSPESFDFLVASLEKDDEATSRLRAELSFSQFMASGTFMANTPAECAGGPGGHAH